MVYILGGWGLDIPLRDFVLFWLSCLMYVFCFVYEYSLNYILYMVRLSNYLSSYGKCTSPHAQPRNNYVNISIGL
jgi:hypothetical protein